MLVVLLNSIIIILLLCILKRHLHFDYKSLQHAKKVVSDSLGLADFAIGLVMFVLYLANGQVLFWEEIQIRKDCYQSC